MPQSMVRRAANEFSGGNYLVALDLYRQLSDKLGERNFRANVWLCEKKLRSQGRRDCTRLPLPLIKVACVMDEFTFHSYQPECSLLPLTPDNALKELDYFNPDILFIESAWRGKDDLWNRKIGTLSSELRSVLQWCKDRQVPTVFWNKEDPIHFETFLTTAQQFDYVCTTDIDCIARYKAALGHERVYLLPFACQPKMHNPFEFYARKDAFCFAGAYYVRYPERTRDLENYVAEFPKFKPLEIFDRNYGKDDINYQFPPKYQPHIVGTLPFNEIDKAYKGYRYAINLNSIKQSQTMFARRVYELLGSNTITVSNFSRGVRLLFGDLVIASDSGKEIVDRLQRLDDEDSQKLRLAGLRKVMLEHTYAHRLAYIAQKALGRPQEDGLPKIVVLAKAATLDELQRVIANFIRQTYQYKQLILLTPVDIPVDALKGIDPDAITILRPHQAAQAQIGEARFSEHFAEGRWVAPMVAEDYYGPNYLLDLAIATRYSDAQIIGKVTRYHHQAHGIHLIDPDHAYRPASRLPKRSSVVRWDVLPRESQLSSWLDCVGSEDWQLPGLAIDPFNYCLEGQQSSNLAEVGCRVDDLPLDTGLPVGELLRVAESIPPAEFDETSLPKWNGNRLRQLYGSFNHPHVSVEVESGALSIRSTLPDGKHEYFYAREDVPIKTLGAGKELQTYLDATPGLDIQYVFVFLNEKKQKISHVIHTANRNYAAAIPAETAFLRFGWRISGSGATSVKYLLWGHRKLEPAQLLGRSDTLLLTNHYPSYDDLYRNAFVHSRVKAYQKHGVKVDVFRLRPNSTTSYHEFHNVDVMTGSQDALLKLLGSGRYRSVLVHFLSPEMWEVLEQYPTLKKIVWVHGAEIQPWHRREYNFQNDQERAKAMRESELRMAFWRGILDPLAPNLKLVFVSRYFAEEVMEDLGFRLPETAYSIIHNPIDTELFSYQPKPVEQRKKVLSIRPYASRTYANDLSVAVILELAKEPFFHEMEFRMIGDGKLFDETLEPLRKFSNVTIERNFLSQGEIAALHKEYGVFLVPSRMDTQGVSRDEAMASGLVPVTNAIAAIPEFLDESCGVLAKAEDIREMALGIVEMYKNISLFERLSESSAKNIRGNRSMGKIIPNELLLSV